jgi:hypothetical protein
MASFFQQLVGSKPEVPDLPSLDLGTEQQKALAANAAAVPGAEAIATKVDLFNQQQIDKMLSNVIPNYQAIRGNINRNIQSLTAGQIPQDVEEAIARSDAGRSLTGGYGGTASARNLQARDLGLTSLDLTQRGMDSAENWMKLATAIYQPGQFNVASMFVSPAQQASFDVEERNSQFQRQWMSNQIAAMPAMWAQDFKESVEEAISMFGGSKDIQHAGSQQVQSANLGTSNFGGTDEQSAMSDYAAGGGMDAGDAGGGSMGDIGGDMGGGGMGGDMGGGMSFGGFV